LTRINIQGRKNFLYVLFVGTLITTTTPSTLLYPLYGTAGAFSDPLERW
jgi:hypothetical protein